MLLLLLLAVLGLWAISLDEIDLRSMNDLGLVSVLPVPFFAALLLLAVGFSAALAARPVNEPLVFAHVVVLAVVLYGTLPMLEDVPRQAAVWRHLGVTDYIVQRESVDREIDAYFNWPGFFIFSAFLAQIGLSNLQILANWTPLLLNLIYIAPLLLIYRIGFVDPRSKWIGVWIFLCSNWVAQDHFSPQGFGYFVFLTITAILVSMLFAVPTDKSETSESESEKDRLDVFAKGRRLLGSLLAPPAVVDVDRDGFWDRGHVSGVRRSWLVAVIAVLFAAVVISHQLTPYAIALVAGALVLVNASSVRALPVLMIVMIFTWFTYSATPFLERFLRGEAQNLGEVSQNLGSGLSGRLAGSPEHMLVVNTRIALSLLVGALAVAGAVYRFRHGHRDAAYAAIAFVPALLVGLQSYGGEILLRSYYFALPGLSFFVAALIATSFRSRDFRRPALAVGSLTVVLLSGFLVARYGNERFDFFTKQEYDASEYLYDVAPTGSMLWVANDNLPWRYRRYADYSYAQLAELRSWSGRPPSGIDPTGVVSDAARQLAEHRREAEAGERSGFVILTRSMDAWVDFTGTAPAGFIGRLDRALRASPHFRRIYSNGDAAIYRYTPSPTGAMR